MSLPPGTGLERLVGVPSLRYVSAYVSSEAVPLLSGLEFLSRLPSLRALGLGGLGEIRDFSYLTEHQDMEGLHLLGCPYMAEADQLRPVGKLTTLSLEQVTVEDLAGLARLRLKRLQLRECRRFTDLTPPTRMSGLSTLGLYGAADELDLTPLAALRELSIGLHERQRVRGIDRLHPSTTIEWEPLSSDAE